MMTQLPSDYQTFIHQSKYARWLDEKGRRETWSETVQRYFDFLNNHLSTSFDFTMPRSLLTELTDAVTNLEIMPSMRALMTSGPVRTYPWIVCVVLTKLYIF